MFKWPSKNVLITSIELDDNNPRIYAEKNNQKEIMRELVDKHNVYGLVKKFLEKGYFPIESIILIEGEKYKYRVVEGNRRVAALKIIHNVESAPKKTRARFQRLLKNVDPSVRSELRRVQAVIAPSREDANIVIADKHIENLLERWDTVMQARFFLTQISKGREFEDIQDEYGVSATRLTRLIRLGEMYSVALNMPLDDETFGKVSDETKFSSSTLERLYNNKDFQYFLGISFNTKGFLSVSSDQAVFTQIYARVITDIAHGFVDTRSLQTAEDIKKYIQKLKTSEETDESGNDFDASKYGAHSYSSSADSAKQDSSDQTKKEQPRKTLAPKNLSTQSSHPRVRQLVHEARIINIERCPIAGALCLRTLLESAIYIILKNRGEVSKVNKGGKRPYLPDMLMYLASPNTSVIQDKALKDVAKVAVKTPPDQSTYYITQLQSLNTFIHNEEMVPTSYEVRNNWKSLEQLIVALLNHKDI